MTLIDTSAWVEFLRRKGAPEVKARVAGLLSLDEAAYTCPVLLELTVGARSDGELALVRETLDLCERMPFLPEYWAPAADVERKLRQQGVTVPRDDVLVAVVAAERQLPLLCRDAHFGQIREKALRSLRVSLMN